MFGSARSTVLSEVMFTWVTRHRVVVWALAWGFSAAGFFTADVFSRPRHGPLVALVLGLVGWSIAGASTLDRIPVRGSLVWAGAYLAAIWLGAIWGTRFEENGDAGFVGALLGWAAGATLGALVSICLNTSRWQLAGPIAFAAIWGLCFFLAGYLSIVAGMVLAQVGKAALAVVDNQRAALTMGWALGGMIGGGLVAAVGLRARDAIVGPRQHTG